MKIQLLESQISSLKSQLANIKYLNADKVEHIIGSINANQEKVQAICKLAIDIDRDKIIEVLMKYYNLNYGNLTVMGIETIADEIIKAIRGVKNDT